MHAWLLYHLQIVGKNDYSLSWCDFNGVTVSGSCGGGGGGGGDCVNSGFRGGNAFSVTVIGVCGATGGASGINDSNSSFGGGMSTIDCGNSWYSFLSGGGGGGGGGASEFRCIISSNSSLSCICMSVISWSSSLLFGAGDNVGGATWLPESASIKN